MPTVDPIKITGLREFQSALKQMDGESQKKLRVVLNDASQTVIGGARRRVPSKTGAARNSLVARSGQREAKVVGGGRKAPYYGWLDFGGRVGRNGAVSRRFIPSGRYMYPSYSANRDSIMKALAESMTALAREAGLEVGE